MAVILLALNVVLWPAKGIEAGDRVIISRSYTESSLNLFLRGFYLVQMKDLFVCHRFYLPRNTLGARVHYTGE